MKLANDKIGLARCLQEVIYRKLSTVRPPLPFFGRRTFCCITCNIFFELIVVENFTSVWL